MHRDKYEIQQESSSPRPTLSEKFASAYGSIRGILLGSNLTGRKAACPESPFTEDAQLTHFRKEKEGQLKPKSVDFMRTINREAHRTSEYELGNLIIRRGQPFELTVHLDRPYQPEEDDVVFKFVTGSRPMQSKSTVVPVSNVGEANSKDFWSYQILATEEKTITVRVTCAADAIVGRYQLFIETFHKTQQGELDTYRFKHPDDIYLLFNPWCADDPVHLEDEQQRLEYVLSETGRIWMGTIGKFTVRPWNFAQFDDVCLMAALSLLERSELGDLARGNPLTVVRCICRMINNNERDGGVLVGNWSGKYDDGVAPHAWNGSSAILEEFLKRRKGVKFGQCWTFAAVATTLCRALGIPTRCVTNFKSAHDSDFSCPVDFHWTSDGKAQRQMDEHIWDYHTWNECWFQRPDLPKGYDGWQAFDSTLQEVSEGVFTCGPAPVKAIKEGQLYIPYDAKYLFAELNGDKTHWSVDQEGNMTVLGTEVSAVGRNISTKAVGAISREDLTQMYKYTEGSKESKKVLEAAARQCFRRVPPIPDTNSQDVDFQFSGEGHRSGDIGVVLKMRNSSGESRIVDVNMCAVSSMYTGVPLNQIKESVVSTVIEPLSESQVVMSLKCSDYINGVEADAHVSVYVHASVKETGQKFMQRQTFWIDKPQLELQAPTTAQVGKSFDLVVKFTNHLSVPVTNGHLNVDGPGIQRLASVKVKKSIAPGEEIKETVQLKPRRLGRKEIIANFYCKQISDITGIVDVDFVAESKV
ncbi:protein-glutamine gamma-glutamyltransferase K-like isoform X2 [Liolophura sinensis]|uniref:protein-glutamine gamma-glutamyltransferase K-like isoform X2 n=1 Tax=Liolophura sinensis TaxID=3198878 RepID=UPI003158FDFC